MTASTPAEDPAPGVLLGVATVVPLGVPPGVPPVVPPGVPRGRTLGRREPSYNIKRNISNTQVEHYGICLQPQLGGCLKVGSQLEVFYGHFGGYHQCPGYRQCPQDCAEVYHP